MDKRYNEMLDWVRGMYPNMDEADKRDAERFFPELAESEDERISKELIALVRAHVLLTDECLVRGGSVTRKQAETWLEKQKEQKPAEWSEEDEKNFEWFEKLFRAESVVIGGRDIPNDKYQWFKSLHPKPHWKPSEEQMNGLYDALIRSRSFDVDILATLYDDLKKL